MQMSDFPSWAVGNLVDNRNRGIFAEWLVGQALGVINPGEVRKEWDAVDLRYRGIGVEIKASGLSQTWNPANTSTPRFDIHKQLQWWDADTDTWGLYDPPQRTADVYVFCLHEAVPATNENVADPSQWRFWIVPTSVLNRELDSQKSVGVTTLNGLSESVTFSEIKTAVEQFLSGEEDRNESALTGTSDVKDVIGRCMSCKERHKVTVNVRAHDMYFWLDHPLEEVWPRMTEAQSRVLIADKERNFGHSEGHNSYECLKCEDRRSRL
jgi:hypothetical protein